jgi:ABC-type multidrug transport system fused ATPase/permease subunit
MHTWPSVSTLLKIQDPGDGQGHRLRTCRSDHMKTADTDPHDRRGAAGVLKNVINVLTRPATSLLRVLAVALDVSGTLILWLLEVLATYLLSAGKLLLRAIRLLLNLALWVAQTLAAPLLGPLQELTPRGRSVSGVRLVGLAVGVFYLVSLAPTLVPAQVGNPLWYLALCRAVVGNGVILVFALFCLMLALSWSEQFPQTGRASAWIQGATRGSMALFLLMVPIQLGGSVLLVRQIRSISTTQLSSVQGRRDVALQQVGRLTDPAALVALFRRFNPPPVTQPSTTLPLPKLRQEVALALNTSAETAKQEIHQQRRNRLLNLAVDSVRMGISLLALATACLGLARWAGSPLSSGSPNEETLN